LGVAIVIIIAKDLYSAMESEDTEALTNTEASRDVISHVTIGLAICGFL